MSSEAALLAEISRLSGAIDRHKTGDPPQLPLPQRFAQRAPPYKPTYRPRQSFTEYTPNARPSASTAKAAPQPTQEVVIDGVAFESNGKTLVRKTARTIPVVGAVPVPKVASSSSVISTAAAPELSMPPQPALSSSVTSKPLVRTRNGLIAADRFKQPTVGPKAKPATIPRSRYPPLVTGYTTRARPGRNLTLNKKQSSTKSKKIEKQCKHFTRTGMCGRGLTCKYQHDPLKIALCPLYLAEKCPFKVNPEECTLSHDPAPERTPICTRFNSTGDCYKGADCLYPHVRVGPKTGICRDFAVLGYCDKGAMCEASHLKECPDFAETGMCKKMHLKGAAGCHLPHVIRANQRRIGNVPKVAKDPNAASVSPTTSPTLSTVLAVPVGGKRKAADAAAELAALGAWEDPGTSKKHKVSPDVEKESRSAVAVAVGPSAGGEDANEFISLTFMESDDDDDEDDDSTDEDDDEQEDDETGDEDEVEAAVEEGDGNGDDEI